MPSDLVAMRFEEAAKKLNKLIMKSASEGKARDSRLNHFQSCGHVN